VLVGAVVVNAVDDEAPVAASSAAPPQAVSPAIAMTATIPVRNAARRQAGAE
jgi:hypothetical protein